MFYFSTNKVYVILSLFVMLLSSFVFFNYTHAIVVYCQSEQYCDESIRPPACRDLGVYACDCGNQTGRCIPATTGGGACGSSDYCSAGEVCKCPTSPPPPTPTPINGSCSVPPTHYNCSSGVLGSTTEYSDKWQWWCNGTNEGTNQLCTEYKAVTPTPTCSINSFTADDTSPTYNTGTTLRFSLSGSFSWNISLLGGSVLPSPTSGTGSSGSSSTGNLTSTHVYRLTCGNKARNLIVNPDDPPPTVCVPNPALCSAPTPACGQTTYGTDNCSQCSKTGGTCACVSDGSCTAPTPSCEQTTWGVNSCGGQCSKTGSTCPTPTTPTPTTPTPPTPTIIGSCGTRNTTYPPEVSSYPPGSTYCSSGSPTSEPSFPSPGDSVNWYCVGNGGSSGQCITTSIIPTYTITVVRTTGGRVESTDSRINCGLTCSGMYNHGSTVVFKALPSSTYWKFSSWTGDCSGFTTNICTLTNVTGPKTVTAIFVPRVFNYIEF